MADERLGDPSSRCDQEPFVVKVKGGRPQSTVLPGAPLLLLIRRRCTIGGLLGVNRFTERDTFG